MDHDALIFKVDPQCPNQDAISQACSILRQGGLVAFPTETFYGLGADALNQKAIEKIFTLKRRNPASPLLILISHTRQLTHIVTEVPPQAQVLIDSFWPGPLTIIFKAQKDLPALLTGGTGTIGIRISSHPIAECLSYAYGGPLTATSANLSGGKNPVTAQDVWTQLGGGLDLILDGGQTGGTKGSTIIDVTSSPPRIVREGDVPIADVVTRLQTI